MEATGELREEESTERSQKSDEGDLELDRKGMSEEGESKIWTEVGVNTARPLGQRRGEMPTREWERSESGRK
jgi:hypothetical protein